MNATIQAIICEEVFDESSHPSVEEIQDYATKIGIDPKNEPHLLYLAKEGLMRALPQSWKPCYDEKSKSYYYYNGQTGKTQWEHPLDDMYRSMVVKVKSGSQASFDEDSKVHEENTYTKEDLQSFEESIPKSSILTKPLMTSLAKIETIHLGAKKKDLKLSPVKLKSKSVQDFNQKNNEFGIDKTLIDKRRGSYTNVSDDLNLILDKNTDNSKNLLLKNDKHPNTIEKGELTLSGGGSMFLKSNTKKIPQQVKLENPNNDVKNMESDQYPKSILRDRSILETFTCKDYMDKKIDLEDDRKIVRFNLETQNVDNDIISSDSEQKSVSDEMVDPNLKGKFEINIDPIIKSRFTISPVFEDEYKNKINGNCKTIFDKKEDLPHNSNLKLIKPNPTDFITPKLIIKSYETMKKISALSESIDETSGKFKSKYPRDELILLEKSNIEVIIPEEDKFFEAISEKHETINVITTPKTFDLESDFQIKFSNQIKPKFVQFKKKIEKVNDDQIQEHKNLLLENKNKAIEEVKQEINDYQEIEFASYQISTKQQYEENMKIELKRIQDEMKNKLDEAIKDEEHIYKSKLEKSKLEIEKNYEQHLDIVAQTFKVKEKEIENNFEMSLKETESDFLLKLEERTKEISLAHNAIIDRLKDDHNIALEELIKDLKSEEEILRKEHLQNLTVLKDKLLQELEVEKQRMREMGEDRLYEKVRCEKRLLEDKYRCLKEKYLRLKTDVRASIERRSHKREQSINTTGSDTERSVSHKKGSSERNQVITHDVKLKVIEQQNYVSKHLPKSSKADINSNHPKGESKNIREITIEDLDTSMSDRSSKHNDNKEKNLGSSEGNINPGRNRRKLFTRLKSSSMSRLNNNSSKIKEVKRSCSPVENLRRQLQKLEDLEDQLPHTTQMDTYHLRYPFSDAGVIYYKKVGLVAKPALKKIRLRNKIRKIDTKP